MANTSIPMKSLKLNSILVATDFTESADRALEHGIAIANHYQAILYLVYVVSSLAFTIAGPDVVELAAEASKRDIDGLMHELADSGRLNGVDARPIVLKGNVDEEVESFARAHRVDLIVASTHGRCGMDRFFFGSVAQMISKRSCCPVLTVGPYSRGPWLDNPADSGKPLLFATAFNDSSSKAVPYAISLANDFERQLYVLHVIPPHHAHLLKKGDMANGDYEASALRHLQALIPSDADRKCAPTLLVESCDPAEGILRAAKRLQAVGIIMGANRDSNADLTTRLPGSITSHVNREAKCAVLTISG